MSAQANDVAVEPELILDEIDKPVYGGLDKRNSVEYLKSSSRTGILELDEYVRRRAVKYLKQNNDANANALIEIGDIHFKNAAFRRVTEPYIQSLKIEPDNIPVYEKLIQAFIALRKKNEADRWFNNLLKRVDWHPKYLSKYLAFRLSLFIDNELDVEDTRIIIKNAISRAGNDDRILNVAALFEMKAENDFEEARRILKKALAVNSDNVHANNNIAITYKFKQDFEKAEHYFNKAHFLDLKYLAAYENLASTYLIQEKNDKAITILENATENGLTLSSNWRHNLAMLYFIKEDYRSSLRYYEEIQREEPDNSLVVNNIGVNYHRLGKIKLSHDYFKKSVSIAEKSYSEGKIFDERACIAFNNLVSYYLDNKKHGLAKSIVKSAQKLFPTHNVAYHQDGLILLSEGNYTDAKAKFKKSLSLAPYYIESAVNLSYILEDFEFEYQEAVELLQRFTTSDNREAYSVVFNNLAYANLKLGNLSEAEKYLLPEDDHYAALSTKGLFYLLSGDRAKSEKLYDDAFKAAVKVGGDKLRLAKQFYYFEHAEYSVKQKHFLEAVEFAREGLEYDINPNISKKLRIVIKRYK